MLPCNVSPPTANDAALGAADLREIYAHMLLARLLDERQSILNRQGRQGIHLSCRGHEGAAAGCAWALDRGRDVLVPSHRSLAAVLLFGVTAYEVLLDCLSRAAGPAGGGRSMPGHFGHAGRRVISMSSPIATQIPHAVGAALASRVRGDGAVTLVFFGDGASSKGDFHEGLNFAGIHKLPVVFVCENNGWSISVPAERQMAVRSVAERAAGYGMPGVSVDGTDVAAAYRAARQAVERARRGEGPTLLEARVARLAPHSSDDDDTRYRPPAEREEAQRRDPLPRLRRELLEAGALDEAEEAALRARLRREVDEALQAAERAEAPGPATAFDHVYAGVRVADFRAWLREASWPN